MQLPVLLKPLLLLMSAFMLSACTSSPTGRQQVLLFSGSDMSQLGGQSFQELKKQEEINRDPKTNQYVQCVADAITARLPPHADFREWEVVVFAGEQINAFALPGGKIGVYSGLLNVAKNQDQLATVIGHEIAHVMAQHGNERLSQSQLAEAGLQLSNSALSGNQYQGLVMTGLGLGVQYGILMPYSRAQESEADIIGLRLMAESGFDPKQSIELWKNMATAAAANHPPEFLSTHPSYSTRIKKLQAEITGLAATNARKPNCSL
jgi:predicted Zn-dependent protease